MVLNTLVTHVGVHVQQIWQQLTLVTNPILINQHLSWPQPITPLITGQPRTILYLIWYNMVPSCIFMNPNMYSMYYSGIKGPNPLISGRKEGYAAGVTQP
jgi:hypothetical protein